MKATFISSNSVSQAMRQQMMRMQLDLTRAETEMVTLRLADPGLTLGARTSQVVSLKRDVDRLGGLVDSNGLITSRLSSSQTALKQVADLATGLMPSLTAAYSGSVDPKIPVAEAKSALAQMTSIMNTAQNGEYLFAGINTDVKPLNDFSDPASAARVAFETSFQDHFGFPLGSPAAASIGAAEMNVFLADIVEPQFFGPDWNANWSNASDQTITARITLNETSSASVSANSDGIRKLAMATTIVSMLGEGGVEGQGWQAVIGRAIELVGEAASDLGTLQGQVGIVEQRVANASERLSMQIDLFKRTASDLEGVDPYEASTRISNLMAQVETSYTLTARIQQLSLVRFLR